jgi:hypothetical protein
MTSDAASYHPPRFTGALASSIWSTARVSSERTASAQVKSSPGVPSTSAQRADRGHPRAGHRHRRRDQRAAPLHRRCEVAGEMDCQAEARSDTHRAIAPLCQGGPMTVLQKITTHITTFHPPTPKASWSFWEIAPPPDGVQLRGAAADAATALTDAQRAWRAMGYDDDLPVEYHEGMSPRGPADRMLPTKTS